MQASDRHKKNVKSSSEGVLLEFQRLSHDGLSSLCFQAEYTAEIS